MKNKSFRSIKVGATALVLLASLIAMPTMAIQVDTGTSDANISFVGGDLTLEKTPSIDFGSHPISAVLETYTSVSISGSIDVSDLRGSGEGWKLLASLSEFQLNGTTPTLQGAYITIPSLNPQPSNGTIGTAPTGSTDIKLTSDNTSATMLTAAVGTGMGAWATTLVDPVTLTVNPGTSAVGNSSAQINWSLENTP